MTTLDSNFPKTLITNLSKHKEKTILILGEIDGRYGEYLTNKGFTLLKFDFTFNNSRDIDVKQFEETSKILDDRYDIGFILSLNGGNYTNLAKLLAMKYYYIGNIKDFFKKKVSPYNLLPIGIYLTTSFNGEEMLGNCVAEDETHHFIYSYSDERLKPTFIEASNNKLENLDDIVWSYLSTGINSNLEKLKIFDLYEQSCRLNQLQELKKIKSLARIIMSKNCSATRCESVLSLLDFIDESPLRNNLKEALQKAGTKRLILENDLKTKIKSKA